MKRRDLLKLTAGSAGSAVLGGMGAAAPAVAAATPAVPPAPVPVPDEARAGYAWSRAAAEALVGQRFWLNHPELRAQPLTLRRVTAPATPPDPRIVQFSLIFEGAALLAVADGTYECQNDSTGLFSLHLTPAGRANGLSQFRADFNLLA